MKALALAVLLGGCVLANNRDNRGDDDHHKPLAVTPEPSTVLLMGAGIAGIGIAAWKKRK